MADLVVRSIGDAVINHGLSFSFLFLGLWGWDVGGRWEEDRKGTSCEEAALSTLLLRHPRDGGVERGSHHLHKSSIDESFPPRPWTGGSSPVRTFRPISAPLPHLPSPAQMMRPALVCAEGPLLDTNAG